MIDKTFTYWYTDLHIYIHISMLKNETLRRTISEQSLKASYLKKSEEQTARAQESIATKV